MDPSGRAAALVPAAQGAVLAAGPARIAAFTEGFTDMMHNPPIRSKSSPSGSPRSASLLTERRMPAANVTTATLKEGLAICGGQVPKKIEYALVEGIVLIARDHVPGSSDIKHFDIGNALL